MRRNYGIALAAICLLLAGEAMQAATLSSNLSNPPAGTENVSGQTWITASFGTDASRFALSSMTLLMSGAPGSSVTLDLYSDNLSQPGQPLFTLTESSALTQVLSAVHFSGANFVLGPNSTYWAVLQATTGSAEWAYTDSNTGTGIRFQHTWGASSNAGADWLVFDSYPMLLGVSAVPVSAVSPEPSAVILVLGGLALLLAVRLKRGHPAKSEENSGLLLGWPDVVKTHTTSKKTHCRM